MWCMGRSRMTTPVGKQFGIQAQSMQGSKDIRKLFVLLLMTYDLDSTDLLTSCAYDMLSELKAMFSKQAEQEF
ncbi:hypothetical protein Tco_1213366 [Tanacetum coccineum]